MSRRPPLLPRARAWTPLLAALLLALGACDDAFSPRADDDRAFALFGTLDGRAARQVLRVQDLTGSVLDTPDRLPATVTSTDLSTGRTTAWRDSLVTLPDGIRAHLFVAALTVAAGETHRIEAVRDGDGARSTVTVRLPTPAVASGPPPLPNSTAAPVVVTALDGPLDEARVRYLVRRPDSTESLSFTAQATPQSGASGVTFLAFLDSAEIQATTLLFGEAPGDPVLVDARLEGVARSGAPVPVSGGVGGVGWAVPISVPIPFSAAAVTQVGFVDGR